MKFSVIVPAFNPSQDDVHNSVVSAVVATDRAANSEVIFIDDCSDNWLAEIDAFAHSKLFRTDKQCGPGAARNVGLDKAQGEWIVFLDSDDELLPDALDCLSAFIAANPDVDAVGYGWEYAHQRGVNQRKDGHCLSLPKRDLLKEYLKLRMDGSVIFTAVKRSLIEEHGMRFRDGLHEDIDFIFNVYRHARKVAYLPEILYRKTDRPGSIVRTMTRAHIDGFIAGWEAVGQGVDDDELWEAYEIGVVGVVATRAREVMYRAADASMFARLASSLPETWKLIVKFSPLDTLYAKIAKALVKGETLDPAVFKMSWGCHDLHNSLFLAPDEVRTCCKRFFVNGEMRGDVVLAKAADANPAAILEAKRHLLLEINKGEPTPCTGCPFLEFKEWGDVAPLRVRHLSMEHHSVCNMECTYCDEKYYGKKQPEYDVLELLRQLYQADAFVGCESVVWGGGEPALGKHFPEMVEHLMGATTAKHRFLTNATVFSPAIATTLQSGRGTVTTSIDAGTEQKFGEIRGTWLGMHRVLNHLHSYAEINPQAVTVKYILTDDNISHDELKKFKEEVVRHELTHCNFQISCDFKKPDATSQVIAAMQLFALLREAGCAIVFFDDLLMQRIAASGDGVLAAEWMRANYADVRAWPEHFHLPRVVVWGMGGMTDWTIANTDFFKRISIVARNRYMPGVPAVITGSQGYADNYRKALAAGVPDDSIVKGLII